MGNAYRVFNNNNMDKFKITSKIIAVLIGFIIIVGGITFYEVPIFNESIEHITEVHKGKIWFLATIVGIVSTMVGYLIVSSLDVMRRMSLTNDKKNDIITDQNVQIISTLKTNGASHNLLMEKINENAEKDIETSRKLVKIESLVIDHENRLRRIEKKK